MPQFKIEALLLWQLVMRNLHQYQEGVATIYLRTALKTEKIYFCLIESYHASYTELWMQEMPPHVPLPLSDPVLDHFNYDVEKPSPTAVLAFQKPITLLTKSTEIFALYHGHSQVGHSHENDGCSPPPPPQSEVQEKGEGVKTPFRSTKRFSSPIILHIRGRKDVDVDRVITWKSMPPYLRMTVCEWRNAFESQYQVQQNCEKISTPLEGLV